MDERFYKTLLIKYMRRVEYAEGMTFVGAYYSPWVTEKEYKELRRIENESKNMEFDDDKVEPDWSNKALINQITEELSQEGIISPFKIP